MPPAHASPLARAGLLLLLLAPPLLFLARRNTAPASSGLSSGSASSTSALAASLSASAAGASSSSAPAASAPEVDAADSAAPDAPPPDEAELADRSRAAVTHEDFARSTLYLWASAEQTALLRRDRALIDTLRKGKLPRLGAPLRKAKDPTSLQLLRALKDSDHTLCGLAWSNPWGTALAPGAKPEPRTLVKVKLRADAYVGSFDGSKKRPWRFVDLKGREVAAGKVMARPERLGAIYYVVDGARPARGYALSSEEAIASWSLDTEELRGEQTSAATQLATWKPAGAPDDTWPRHVADELWPKNSDAPESTLASTDEGYQPEAWGALPGALKPAEGKTKPLVVKPSAGKPFGDLTTRGVHRQVCTEHGDKTRCAALPPPKRRAHDGRFCVDDEGHMRDCKAKR